MVIMGEWIRGVVVDLGSKREPTPSEWQDQDGKSTTLVVCPDRRRGVLEPG